jgi:molecular chaperone GrpE (heat shock protein)
MSYFTLQPSSGTSSQVDSNNSELPDLGLIDGSEIINKSDNDSRISDTEDNKISESEVKNIDDNNSDNNTEDDLESMSKKLAQAKKEAEEYRQQLVKKEQEAEEYMKKLQSLTK